MSSCVVSPPISASITGNHGCSGLPSTRRSDSPAPPSSTAACCLLDGQLFENPKPEEAVYAAKRAEKAKQLLAGGTTIEKLRTHDTARDYILPDIIDSMKRQNITYSVIDGFPIPEQHVPVITLDFQPHEIVFATDGYPFLCPTLAESEQRLAEQRQNDPLNIHTFLASKAFMMGQDSFDDRTYIRFKV